MEDEESGSHIARPDTGAGEPLSVQKDHASLELERLSLELASLKKEQARPWILRLMLPVLVASLAGSFSAWVFSDSLAERSRADLRKEILISYLAVENRTVGKRSQILDFAEQVLVDDKRLKIWVLKEREALAFTEQELTAELAGIEQRLRAIDPEFDGIQLCGPSSIENGRMLLELLKQSNEIRKRRSHIGIGRPTDEDPLGGM